MVLALTGGELVYFEMEITGQLVEVDKKEMSGEISCLDISAVPEGRQRAKFLAVRPIASARSPAHTTVPLSPVRIFWISPD